MKAPFPRNIAASVRQKLLNLSVERGEDFGLILTRYTLERLLYRLSRSQYRDRFILKGAMLFQVWTRSQHRPSRDLDLLGRGDPSPKHCEAVFRELCALPVEDDGMVFSAATVRSEKIREEREYGGLRIKFFARLENARISVQVDVGFGDAVIPRLLDYPTILEMPAPQIQAYPMSTAVAEKAEAIVSLGMLNSRMKDFYDIWFLSTSFPFEFARLAAAIRATFARRRTPLDPGRFDALLGDLSNDDFKRTQWVAFLRRSHLTASLDFTVINEQIRQLLGAPMGHVSGESQAADFWPPGGPWSGSADTWSHRNWKDF